MQDDQFQEKRGTSHMDAIPIVQYPRRVRHITGIQIRNLTPFPARDALASALNQPAQPSQFTPQGHLADDLDVAVGRARARRLSSSSNIRLAGVRNDSESVHRDGVERTSEGMMRRRTLSKASTSASSSAGAPVSSGAARRPSGGVSTVRPPQRQRTTSAASVFTVDSDRTPATDWRDSRLSSLRLPQLLQDTSQSNLEKVLQGRLVETFITISTLSSEESRSRRASLTGTSTKNCSSRPGAPSSAPSPIKSGPPRSHSRAASSSSNGKVPRSPISPKTPGSSTHRQRPSIPSSLPPSPSPSASGFPVTPPATPPLPSSPELLSNKGLAVPDYISPIQRPSTNPTFQIDAQSKGEFTPGVDLSGSKFRVEVWGKAKHGLGWASTRGVDIKEKSKQTSHGKESGSEWRVLESWDVDLMNLVPLTEDLAAHPSHLHSNALVVTLSPQGQTYYLPPPTSPHKHALSSTDASGYSSEPESDVRNVKSAGKIDLSNRPEGAEVVLSTSTSSTRDLGEKDDNGSFRRKGKRVTSSWPDLLQIIDMQARIEDTRRSLSAIVHDIDELVTQPGPTLRREVSEREAWAGQLHAETNTLRSESDGLRERIQARREALQTRKGTLAAARECHESYLQLEFDLEQEIIDERHRLNTLRRDIDPLRSDVINTLAFVFPIELLSPPDLLFTIIDVPLPIPVGATDPAPPLSLPSHKDVTEETVATALGYAAQVVHLLAAYMGKHLVYPVTNIGSRSLIKDSISAMVGPRSFPLFTKGVETYRFEYGVYLLNKDIELLMSERNLRALDVRHTLPNLKNLLLTLTGSEGATRSTPRFSVASSSGSLASLRSPILTASSLPSAPPSTSAIAPSEHKVSGPPDGLPTVTITSPTVADTESPPRSGSTTPTRSVAEAATSRKSRAFLDLTPLTGFGFLRGRYASGSSRSASGSQDGPSSETAHDGEVIVDGGASAAEPPSGATDEEDDRRTIRGRRDTITTDAEGKVIGNGCAVRGQDAGEKAANSNGVLHSDAPLLVHGTS